jgi:peptidoglycan/xylan/chitin deacetylase (PgdA/CDA1 family)
VTPELFESHVKTLRSRFEIVTVEELLKSKSKRPLLALTFDDGYEDNLKIAAPILKKYGLKATLFAIGSTPNRKELDNQLPLLSISDIKKLHADFGWDIGFHTATHADLSKLTSAGIESEIVTGKANFEKLTGLTLRSFAYPRGFTNSEVIAAVKRAAFRYGLTVDGRQVDPTKPLTTDRINIEGKTTSTQLLALLTPIGLTITSALNRLLQIKEYILTPRFL